MHRDLPAETSLSVESEAAIAQLLVRGHPVLVAYSGGKDSTVLLALTLNAARVLKQAGVAVPRIIITHGDTGIENPTVSQLARAEMAKARAFGQTHGLDVVAEVAEPSLNETWAVAILSGRRLPTFSNSSTRDCTLNWKINPMVRLRKQLLRPSAPGVECSAAPQPLPGRPVTLIGTRYEESTSRAARMTERGETALEPWEKDGALYMSPIAQWTTDDVWTYLGGLRSGECSAFTTAEAVFDVYASAGGSSCAVVADMATESVKKARACGARFGCSLCTAVGRDKSLENMLESDPSYAWLKPLNALQRFLVETQYDFTRRTWLGRQIDDEGFLKVYPDTYSPLMLQELLRYALTADAIELEASREAGLQEPRYQLVSERALVAIDAFWSLHAQAKRPFEALAIWREVHHQGQRFYPPQDLNYPPVPFPAARFLYVGKEWQSEAAGRAPAAFSGMRDVLRELVAREADSDGHKVLPDGRKVLVMEESPLFDVDQAGALDFLQHEAQAVLARYHDGPRLNSSRAFLYYAQLGVISTFSRHQSTLDQLMRRAAWKRANGWDGPVELCALLEETVDAKGRQAQVLQIEQGLQEQPGPVRPMTVRERLCTPVYL